METPTRSQWGPVAWKMLHYYALSYPTVVQEEDKQRALVFLEHYADMLPCVECAEFLRKELEGFTLGEVVLSRKAFVDFTHALHNRVNARLNKKQLSLAQFYAEYSSKPKAPATTVAPRSAPAPKVAVAPKVAPRTALAPTAQRGVPKTPAKEAPRAAVPSGGVKKRTVQLPAPKPVGYRSRGGCASCRG